MCMSTQRVTKARLMFRKYVHRPVGDSGLKPAQCRTQKSIEKGGTHLALSGRRSGWSVSIVSYGFHWKRNVWPTAWSVISYWRPLSTCWCRCPPVELISSMRRSCWATRLKRGSIPKGHPPETKHNNETNQWTIFFFWLRFMDNTSEFYTVGYNRTTRLPITTVARKNGMQVESPTSIQSHMDSIHSPHRTRNTIMKECMKSMKCQRGSSLSGNRSTLSTGFWRD